jgi:hypothetical protein
MTHPSDVDGKDGTQGAMNILNLQLQTANKGKSSTLGVGHRVKNPSS